MWGFNSLLTHFMWLLCSLPQPGKEAEKSVSCGCLTGRGWPRRGWIGRGWRINISAGRLACAIGTALLLLSLFPKPCCSLGENPAQALLLQLSVLSHSLPRSFLSPSVLMLLSPLRWYLGCEVSLRLIKGCTAPVQLLGGLPPAFLGSLSFPPTWLVWKCPAQVAEQVWMPVTQQDQR